MIDHAFPSHLHKFPCYLDYKDMFDYKFLILIDQQS